MNQPMMPEGTSQKKMWLWLVVGAVVIIVLAALWWFWQGPTAPAEENGATTALETQGTSDEVSAIDTDLQATDLGNLDAELEDIDSELAK